MTKTKIHIRKTKSRIMLSIACIIAAICLAGLCSSAYEILVWRDDSIKTTEQSEKILKDAPVAEVSDNDNTQTAGESNKKSLYWRYLDTKLIDVNFEELKKQNPDTKGWIRVSGSNVNYPFVQTSNNDYYLKHSFDKSPNASGWVFADFRNHLDGSDKNMILYAHGRYEGTMFGSLRNILTNGWLDNPDNFTILTSMPEVNGLWQVFSTYKIPVTNDYIQTQFNSDEEYENFLHMIQSRSAYNFNASVSKDDRILTLSTCLKKGERMVIHARLIKWEEKDQPK